MVNISPRDLLAEYERFSAAYPFVHDVETAHALPPFTLFAVASRETNMVDKPGDGDHGHGAWQLDDRSHRIPQPFPVAAQADIAASMLVDLRHRFGDWISAFNAYNSGQPQTRFTAHGDYGPDVDARRTWLAANVTPPDPPAPAPPVPPQHSEIAVDMATLTTSTFPFPEPPTPAGAGWCHVDIPFEQVTGVFGQAGNESRGEHWPKVVPVASADGDGTWVGLQILDYQAGNPVHPGFTVKHVAAT